MPTGAPTNLKSLVGQNPIDVSGGHNDTTTSVTVVTGQGASVAADGGIGSLYLWYNETDYASEPRSDPDKEWIRVTGRSTDTLTVTRAASSDTPVAKNHNTVGKSYRLALNMPFQSSGMCLQFTDNSSDEVWFSLERCSGAGCSSFSEVLRFREDSGNGNAGSVQVFDQTNGLTPGSTYRWRVRAADSAFTSFTAYSNEIEWRLGTASVPAAPTIGTATNNNSTTNTITWTHASSGSWTLSDQQVVYSIERKLTSESALMWRELDQKMQTELTYVDRTCIPSTAYDYRVRAYDYDGKSAASSTASATTAATAAPTASLSISPTTVYVNEPFKWDLSASTNVRDVPFNDGSARWNPYQVTLDGEGTEPTVVIKNRAGAGAFRTPGSHTVTASVKGYNGSVVTTSQEVTVLAHSHTGDSAHTCSNTASDTSACTTAYHQPTSGNINALRNALVSSGTQTSPIIQIPANSTYNGGVVLPGRATNIGWLWLRSSAYASFTAQVRAEIGDTNLAHITYPGSLNPAIQTTNSGTPTNKVRITGIAVTMASGINGTSTDNLIELGNLSEANPSEIPSHISFEHCAIYGHTGSNLNISRGFEAGANYFSIVDSVVDNINGGFSDTVGIVYAGNGAEVSYTDNCLIRAAGENVFFGGATTHLPPPAINGGRYHTMTRVWLPKDDTLRTDGTKNAAFTVKNNFETKSVQFLAVVGAILEGNFPDGQDGTPVIFKSLNQDQWQPTNYTQDVYMSNFIIRKVRGLGVGSSIAAIQILDRDQIFAQFVGHLKRLYLDNFLIYDDASASDAVPKGSFKVAHTFGEHAAYVVVSHGTMYDREHGAVVLFFEEGWHWGPPQEGGWVFINNMWAPGGYWQSDWPGFKGMSIYVPNSGVFGNIISDEGGISGNSMWSGWTSTNITFPANNAAIGFENYATRDFRLTAGSAYKGDATDGTDPGANFTDLVAALGSSTYNFADDTTKIESGDWTGGGEPITAQLVLTTYAPTVSVTTSARSTILGRSSIDGRCSIL